jgi:2-polyprenyl-6-hydroxyphenyl methylase/3-demethylubiquinone-9 3-methyltransferase
MPGYYTEKLAAQRLRACYDLAPPRVTAYLEAEIAFVLRRTAPAMTVLEMGCGFGRVLRRLAPCVRTVVGIDTSLASLRMAQELVGVAQSLRLAAMDASRMGFADHTFDLTLCIQNGISAFGVDQKQLFAEAVRVTRSGGIVLFSSYAERLWKDRLEWFEVQAAHGLIGEIDYAATGDGVIVCKDGFRATTVSADEFRALAETLNVMPNIVEVDGSSVFCEMIIP